MRTKQFLILIVCTFAFANTYAANRYWVADTTPANWADASSWSATSGGTSGATAPLIEDDVFFESGSATTVTLDATVTVNSITFKGRAVNFAGAFAIVTTNMTVDNSQIIFFDNVTVNSSLAFPGTKSSIRQKSGTSFRAFKMGNGGAFTLTGNSASNFFAGNNKSYFTFDTTSPLTVYFEPAIPAVGGLVVTKGLITIANSIKSYKIVLNATNNQELIVGKGATLILMSGANASSFTSKAGGGVINASVSGSKVLIQSTSATVLGAQPNGPAITGKIFKDNSTINHLEYNSTAVFNLPQAIRVRTLTKTAGTMNNSTNNITIATGGSVIEGAGSTSAAIVAE